MQSASAADPAAAAQPDGSRIRSLDGLRGVAALVVVAFHVSDLVAWDPAVRRIVGVTPLGVFMNGPAAVHVFFVLSGFVLSHSLLGAPGVAGTLRYCVRRVFRIHPPYMAAVLFAWALTFLPLGSPAETEVAGVASLRIPLERMPLALALPSKAFGQLPVGWSLYVELAMSLVLPLLLWIARRSDPLVVVAIGFLLPLHPQAGFLVFTIDFAVGMALYLSRDRIARFVPQGGVAAGLWVVAALALLQTPALGGAAGVARTLAEHQPPGWLVPIAAGSALLTLAALEMPAVRRCLASRAAVFLGRISYSLYLVHWSVVMLLGRLVGAPDSAFTAVLFFAMVTCVSCGVAMLGWRWVEQPSIAAGRALLARLAPRASKAAA
jgi:peptidoglycan/LPS O-acetylase OafA/YrhL